MCVSDNVYAWCVRRLWRSADEMQTDAANVCVDVDVGTFQDFGWRL